MLDAVDCVRNGEGGEKSSRGSSLAGWECRRRNGADKKNLPSLMRKQHRMQDVTSPLTPGRQGGEARGHHLGASGRGRIRCVISAPLCDGPITDSSVPVTGTHQWLTPCLSNASCHLVCEQPGCFPT